MKIKFSELKALRDIVGDEWRVVEDMPLNDLMTEDMRWRLIAASAIDEIQQEELASDEYVLGCFADWALAEVLPIEIDTIQRMQQNEDFSALGLLVLDKPERLAELQQNYASIDGYGHHFSHYDGSEEEITLGGQDYYVFRVN